MFRGLASPGIVDPPLLYATGPGLEGVVFRLATTMFLLLRGDGHRLLDKGECEGKEIITPSEAGHPHMARSSYASLEVPQAWLSGQHNEKGRWRWQLPVGGRGWEWGGGREGVVNMRGVNMRGVVNMRWVVEGREVVTMRWVVEGRGVG
jgi:hypothetical protein